MKIRTARLSFRQAGTPAAMRPRIYVVDDDQITRDTIAGILRGSGYRVSKYGDAAEFLADIDLNDYGCLLVDIRMPGMNGIQLIEQLVRVQALFAILVVSGYADVPLAVHAIKAGALDVIQKPFSKTMLLDNIARALSAMECDRSIERTKSVSHGSPTLSAREQQVLKLTIAGHSSKEIARQLGGSPRTVETHRANIMKKMGIKRLSALVRPPAFGGSEE